MLVLGAGWVGSRLALRLHESGLGVRVTNRPGTAVGAKEPYFRASSCRRRCGATS